MSRVPRTRRLLCAGGEGGTRHLRLEHVDEAELQPDTLSACGAAGAHICATRVQLQLRRTSQLRRTARPPEQPEALLGRSDRLARGPQRRKCDGLVHLNGGEDCSGAATAELDGKERVGNLPSRLKLTQRTSRIARTQRTPPRSDSVGEEWPEFLPE